MRTHSAGLSSQLDFFSDETVSPIATTLSMFTHLVTRALVLTLIAIVCFRDYSNRNRLLSNPDGMWNMENQ